MPNIYNWKWYENSMSIFVVAQWQYSLSQRRVRRKKHFIVMIILFVEVDMESTKHFLGSTTDKGSILNVIYMLSIYYDYQRYIFPL